jgi:hypothetical protein
MRDTNFCPICGKKFENWTGHRCNPKYLVNRDRALKTDRIDGVGRPRSERARLELGFALLMASGDDQYDD